MGKSMIVLVGGALLLAFPVVWAIARGIRAAALRARRDVKKPVAEERTFGVCSHVADSRVVDHSVFEQSP